MTPSKKQKAPITPLSQGKRQHRGHSVFWICSAALFAASFIFLQFVVEPRLYLFSQQTGFFFNSIYAKTFLNYPSGPSDWVANLLMQFFESDLSGTLIVLFFIAVLVAGLDLLIFCCARNTQHRWLILFCIVAGHLWICSDYQFPLSMDVKLCIALAAALVLVKIPLASRYVKVAALILMPGIYCAAGEVAMILFAFLTLIHLVSKEGVKKNGPVIAIALVLGAGIPFLVFHGTALSESDAWSGLITSQMAVRPPPFWRLHLFAGLFLVLPAFFVLLSLKRQTSENRKGGSLVAPLAFMVLIICANFWQFDRTSRNALRVSYYAEQRNWDKVLELAPHTGGYNLEVNMQVNRALFFKGNLMEDFFKYPQESGSEALIPEKRLTLAVPLSDLYFDLGYLSESLRWAYEAQSYYPHSPGSLKRIIQCYLVLGNKALAEKYLAVLEDNFMCRDWVRATRQILTAPPQSLVEKRRQIPKPGIIMENAGYGLKVLVDTDPQNRMASDYLLLHCLLNLNLEDLSQCVEKRVQAGGRLPKVVQEAILMRWDLLQSVDNPNLKPLISTEVQNEHAAFIQAIQQNGIKNAQPILARIAASTCWYYALYVNPMAATNKVESGGGR